MDARGAKAWQVRYLKEIEDEEFTPLVEPGSVRDEVGAHERSLSLSGRMLMEPKTDGADSPRANPVVRDPTTSAKLEQLLAMLQEQDAVLSGLVEREKERQRERDLERSKSEEEEPFQSEEYDSSADSGFGPVTSPQYPPPAPVPTPPALFPSRAAPVPPVLVKDEPKGVVTDFVDTSDSETAQSIQLQER